MRQTEMRGVPDTWSGRDRVPLPGRTAWIGVYGVDGDTIARHEPSGPEAFSAVFAFD